MTRMTDRHWKQSTRGLGCAVLLVLASGCTSVRAPVEERQVPVGAGASAVRSPLMEPPGAFLTDVTQSSIATTICKSGWTATVRPSSTFTQGVKFKLLREADLDRQRASDYELDHFVPLALGGHPRSIDNLWLQRWDGEWDARIKDRLERRLQVLVCAGRVTLQAAQTAIQRNWKGAYRKYVGSSPSKDFEIGDDEAVD